VKQKEKEERMLKERLELEREKQLKD